MKEIITLAQAAQEHGWRVLVVGGYVRDLVTGAEPKDADCEIYGAPSVEAVVSFLFAFGEVDAVGKSFGVLKVKINGKDFDVSLPRRDNKTGAGHTGFICEHDPTMTPEEAASRRDFTMNSMMYDPLTQEILDPFGGGHDIHNGYLRHTSSAFVEDHLRVLRGMQFCGRFGLQPAQETIALCQSILPVDLAHAEFSTDRIWGEFEKWALKSVEPSRGMEFLVLTQWAKLFPEIFFRRCYDDVDRAAEYCNRWGIDGEDRIVILLSALCDNAKKDDGIATFLQKIGTPKHIAEKVKSITGLIFKYADVSSDVRHLAVNLKTATVKQFCGYYHSIGHFILARRMEEEAKIQDCYTHKQPAILQGRHLLEIGIPAGEVMGQILRAAYEKQLDGEFEDIDDALNFAKECYDKILS